MGLWTREHAGHDTAGVIAHSDKGVQYLAVRYTQRLAEAGAVAPVRGRASLRRPCCADPGSGADERQA